MRHCKLVKLENKLVRTKQVRKPYSGDTKNNNVLKQ